MPGDSQKPDLGNTIAALAARIDRLERKFLPATDTRHLPALFTYDGQLITGLESPAWRPIVPVELDLIVVDVVTPGSGDIDVRLLLDGNDARDITLPSGDSYVEDVAKLVIPTGSRLTAIVTAAPDDARSLSIAALPRFLGSA